MSTRFISLSLLLCAGCGADAVALTPPAQEATVLHIGHGAPMQVAAEAPEDPGAPPPLSPLRACVAEMREASTLRDSETGTRYARALEHERAGRLDEARKGYLQLIQESPTSRHIPFAYLAFGELFFLKTDQDPSMLPLALQAYAEVAKYPPPENLTALYAQHQLAEVRRRQADFPGALADLKKTVTLTAVYSSLPCARQIAERARADIVGVYVVAGQPERAYSFFATVTRDPSGALEMLAALAEGYVAADQPAQALGALASAPAAPAPRSYCEREAALLGRLGTLSPGGARPANDPLLKAHQARCASP